MTTGCSGQMRAGGATTRRHRGQREASRTSWVIRSSKGAPTAPSEPPPKTGCAGEAGARNERQSLTADLVCIRFAVRLPDSEPVGETRDARDQSAIVRCSGSSAGYACAIDSWGEASEGGGAPLRVY